MKFILALVAVVVSIGSASAYYAYSKNQRQTEQVADYALQVKQLLLQVEEYSLKRLGYEDQIQQLQSELLTLSSQLTSVSNQLHIAEQQTDPDYQRLETEIRQRLSKELRQQSETSTASPLLNIIKQLANMDPAELGELMSLQAQFGGFLQSLNVSDERMEVVVGALSNLIADQNQARMELVQQVQQEDFDPREMRSEMRAISNPQTSMEILSYDLTEDELTALGEFYRTQREQGQQNSIRSFIGSPAGGGQAVFLGGGFRRQSGSGTAQAVQIIPRQNR